MRRVAAVIVAAVAAFAASAVWAMAVVEFMEMDNMAQYKVVLPMQVAFLKGGYKNVPDNAFVLVDEIKKLTFEKGYTYQSLDEVAKEAAIRLGMKRAF